MFVFATVNNVVLLLLFWCNLWTYFVILIIVRLINTTYVKRLQIKRKEKNCAQPTLTRGNKHRL